MGMCQHWTKRISVGLFLLILLQLAYGGQNDLGQVELYLEDTCREAKEGTTCSLVCNLPGVTGQISWYKDGKPLSPDGRKYSILHNRELSISDLLSSDSGTYSCIVKAANMQGEGSYALDVKYGFSSRVIDMEVSAPEEGHGRALKCEQTREGNPSTVFRTRWFLNGRNLPVNGGRYQALPGSDGHELYISSLHRTDTGNYTCHIDNGQDSGVRDSASITVRYPPSKPSVKPSNQTVEVNTNITVQCIVDDAGYPLIFGYKWRIYQLNQIIVDYTESATLHDNWKNVGLVKYSCQAESAKYYSEQSENSNIFIQAPVKIEDPVAPSMLEPTLGEDTVVLNCTVSGSNITNIIWTQDGNIINNSQEHSIHSETIIQNLSFGQKEGLQKRLRIEPIMSSISTCEDMKRYSSSYWCKAIGRVANRPSTDISEKIQVNFMHFPLPRDNSVTGVAGVVGTAVNISCPVCMYPIPQNTGATYKWFFKQGKLPQGARVIDGRVVIDSIKEVHFGEYQCQVKVAPEKSGATYSRNYTTRLDRRGGVIPEDASKRDTGQPKTTITGIVIGLFLLIVTVTILVIAIIFLLKRNRELLNQPHTIIMCSELFATNDKILTLLLKNNILTETEKTQIESDEDHIKFNLCEKLISPAKSKVFNKLVDILEKNDFSAIADTMQKVNRATNEERKKKIIGDYFRDANTKTEGLEEVKDFKPAESALPSIENESDAGIKEKELRIDKDEKEVSKSPSVQGTKVQVVDVEDYQNSSQQNSAPDTLAIPSQVEEFGVQMSVNSQAVVLQPTSKLPTVLTEHEEEMADSDSLLPQREQGGGFDEPDSSSPGYEEMRESDSLLPQREQGGGFDEPDSLTVGNEEVSSGKAKEAMTTLYQDILQSVTFNDVMVVFIMKNLISYTQYFRIVKKKDKRKQIDMCLNMLLNDESKLSELYEVIYLVLNIKNQALAGELRMLAKH